MEEDMKLGKLRKGNNVRTATRWSHLYLSDPWSGHKVAGR